MKKELNSYYNIGNNYYCHCLTYANKLINSVLKSIGEPERKNTLEIEIELKNINDLFKLALDLSELNFKKLQLAQKIIKHLIECNYLLDFNKPEHQIKAEHEYLKNGFVNCRE